MSLIFSDIMEIYNERQKKDKRMLKINLQSFKYFILTDEANHIPPFQMHGHS